jgi:hypothetical protein
VKDSRGKQGPEPASADEPEERTPSPEAPDRELTGLSQHVDDKPGKEGPTRDPEEEPEEESTSPTRCGRPFDPGIVEYVRMVTSLIEGWKVSRDEILEMLERTMRQRSMGRERRIDYVVRFLKEQDPP